MPKKKAKRVLVGDFCALLMTLTRDVQGQIFTPLQRRYKLITPINQTRSKLQYPVQ